jgi:hypothetical protein
MRAVRYSDVFNRVFQRRSAGMRCLRAVIRKEVHAFRSAPIRLVHLPACLQRMTTTQSLFLREEVEVRDIVEWSLGLSAFIRRRSARLIQRRWLECFYRPDGAWFRKTFAAPGGPRWLLPP